MFKEKKSWKSKIMGALASVGAAAMLLGMAVPAIASATSWSATLPAFRLTTTVAAGNISGSQASTYSVWLNSIDPGNRAVLWAANPSGDEIGSYTILPKNDGGTATTLSYTSTQYKGNPIRLRGRTEKISGTSVYVTGRVNFG